MDPLDILCNSTDGYVIIDKQLLSTLGQHESMMIGELSSKYNYWKNKRRLTSDGYFYISREDIYRDTGISKFQQKKCCENLKKVGLVDIKKKDCKGVNYYKINTNVLSSFVRTKEITE